MNITDPIRVLARERPDAIAAMRQQGRTSTYAELDLRIDGLARRLTTLGVVPGDVAIVAIGTPLREFVMTLALARIGAAASTWTFPAERAALCLVSRGEPGPGHPRTVVVEREWFSEPPPAGAGLTPTADASAVALFVAATSHEGERRFVPLTHAAIAARIAAVERVLPSTAEDRQLTLLATNGAHGFLSLLRMLWVGGCNVYVPPRPGQLVATARDSGANRLAAQPNSLAALLAGIAHGERPLPALERIELSGGEVPAKLLALARERGGGEIHSLYRTTECGPVAAAPTATLDRALGDVGAVLPGVEVVAVDANGSPLPPGTEGRLRVSGAGVAMDTCITDDRGSVTTGGTVRLAAPAGGVINAGGNRVHPGRLEEALAKLPWIGDAAVFSIPDSYGLVQVGAAIVPTGRPVPEDFKNLGMRNDMNTPTVLMQVREIPRDAAGAPRRDQLAEMAIANRGAGKGKPH